ncbi:MAG: hypothetical protein Q9210_003249 [Variospora velana]
MDDRSRIPILVESVASIPEDVYGESEFSKESRDFMLQKVFIASDELPKYLQYHFLYDKYRFGAPMLEFYWREHEQRRILEPLFVFVYRKTFKEMDDENPTPSLSRDARPRNPWSPKDAKK